MPVTTALADVVDAPAPLSAVAGPKPEAAVSLPVDELNNTGPLGAVIVFGPKVIYIEAGLN